MKLLNYTSAWFGLILFLVLSIWATVFYFNMLDEIYDSMDDGLENQKLLVIRRAEQDGEVLLRDDFDDGYYKVSQVPFEQVENYTDVYQDTLIYTLNEEDFEPFRMLKTVFELNGNYYHLSLITSMVEEDDLIEDLFYALVFLYLGLIFSVLILNNFLLKKIWRPFYNLLDNLKTFRLDDPKPFDAKKTRIDEFQLLNDSVKKLLEKNIQTYNSQKQFIENASHEIQTPLAISLNKLELLAENHHLDDEALPIVASVMDNLERLSRLNKSLLLLSKIINKQFPGEEQVDFSQLVKKSVDDFSDLAAHRNISISLNAVDGHLIRMNPDLAAVMVTNLLKNALVHNHSGGWVDVILTKESLTVENSGQATPLNKEKIFERLEKGSSSPQSNGLGLSIVRAIAELYGFSIDYAFQDKHIMKLRF